MQTSQLKPETIRQLLVMQQEEINSHHTYARLAVIIRDKHNQETVSRISDDELGHYHTLKQYTQQDLKPNWTKINFFFWISRIFGITFGIKLMEQGEEKAQEGYKDIAQDIPELEQMLEDEEKHEKELLEMIDEEGLKYAGSVVLGLNDALVELTGALAGLTFAFQNTSLIALAGLITGISASFSMAASEYLATKSEEGERNPLKSAIYTGIAYIITVFFLVLPYLIFKNYLLCLALTILTAVLIIAVFNYYISVAKDLSFRKRFGEMTMISLGVALLSFGIGVLIRNVIGIEI